MEELWPFEFAGVYYFVNKEISKVKYHIYVGSKKYFEKEVEHHFFVINSKRRKIYAPHHPIFAGALPKKYPFLKRDSVVSCKKIFIELPQEKDIKRIDRINYDDMKAILQQFLQVESKTNKIAKFMDYYLENTW